MPQYQPGSIVESRCTRCNDVTGHVIIAVVGGEIAKVECRACGSVHKYRAPEGKARAASDTPRRVRQGASRTDAIRADQADRAEKAKRAERVGASARPSSRTARAAEAQEEAWRSALVKGGEAQAYSMDAHFALGDIVEHPSFGNGVVKELVPPDKVRILFQDGLRLLRCAG